MKHELGKLFSEDFENQEKDVIKDTLSNLAHSIENGPYSVILSDEEKKEKRKELADIMIEISDKEQEKKDFVDQWKLEYKPMQEDKKQLIDIVKYGSENRYGDIFHIPDYELNLMSSFDERGVCIAQRALTAKERQSTIFDNVKQLKNG